MMPDSEQLYTKSYSFNLKKAHLWPIEAVFLLALS